MADTTRRKVLNDASTADEHGADDGNTLPQLKAAIDRYISTGDEDTLVLKYQQYGEESAEFAGLGDEIASAIRDPAKVRRLFADDHTDSELRDGLVDLSDRLRGTGRWAPEQKRALEGEELFNAYAGIPMRGPGGSPLTIRGWVVPLWAVLAAAAAVTLLGIGLRALPMPSALTWVASMMMLMGWVTMVIVSTAMLMRRREARNPEDTDDDKANDDGKGRGRGLGRFLRG